jgi:quinol monooxygenase YgiN
MIEMTTTPHPDGWLEYMPRPDLECKQLGVLAHTWFKTDTVDQMGPVFRTITDIAVEEPTGIALDANVSLQNPLHNMMYEEWESYDEFFTVQLGRPYRMAFLRWLIPVMAAQISAEFYEIVARAGSFSKGDGTSVLSMKVDAGSETEAQATCAAYVTQITDEAACLGVTAMRSLNDPLHFVVVERRDDPADLGMNLSDLSARETFAGAISALGGNRNMTAETYRVHYNPERFEMPT